MTLEEAFVETGGLLAYRVALIAAGKWSNA